MVAEGMPFRDAYKAAAEQYASLKIPSQEEISASYKHTGSIAERVSGKYEERVKSIKQWFEETRKEWDAIAEQLKR
jgi:argininosuccinate lyase